MRTYPCGMCGRQALCATRNRHRFTKPIHLCKECEVEDNELEAKYKEGWNDTDTGNQRQAR